MPGNERIDSLFDIPSVKREVDLIHKMLGDLGVTIAQGGSADMLKNRTLSLKEMKAAIEDTNKSAQAMATTQKAVETQITKTVNAAKEAIITNVNLNTSWKKGSKSVDDLLRVQVRYQTELVNTKSYQADLNKELKNGALTFQEYSDKSVVSLRYQDQLKTGIKEVTLALKEQAAQTLKVNEIIPRPAVTSTAPRAFSTDTEEMAPLQATALASGAINENTRAKLISDTTATTAAVEAETSELQANIQAALALKLELTGLSAAQKELTAQLTAGNITQAEYITQAGLLEERVGSAKIQMSDFTQRVAAMQKEMLAGQGSIDQMSARLGILKDEYRSLNAVAKESTIGQSIKAEIDLLDPVVKRADASIGNFGRMVGNYSGALQKLERELYAVRIAMSKAGGMGDGISTFQTLELHAKLLEEEIVKIKTAQEAAGTSVMNTTAKQRIAFTDIGRLVTGQAFSLRTFASNFTLLGAQGAIAFAILYGLWEEFGKEIFKAKDRLGSLNDKIKKTSEAVAGSSKEYETAAEEVDKLTQYVDLAKQGFISKDGVVKEYNTTIGKTIGLAKNLDEVEQLLAKHADAYIKFTLLKAAANVALGKAAEQAFQVEYKRQQQPKEFRTTADKVTGAVDAIPDANLNSSDSTRRAIAQRGKKLQEEGQKDRDDLRKRDAIQQSVDAKFEFEQIAKRFNDDAAKISKDNNFNFFQTDKLKKSKDAAKKELFDFEDAFNKLHESINAFDDKSLGIDIDPLKRELQQAFDEYNKFFVQLRDLRYKSNAAIDQAQKDGDITGSQAAKDRLRVESKFNEDSLALNKALLDNQSAIREKFYQEEQKKEKERDAKALKASEQKMAGVKKQLENLASQQLKDQVTQDDTTNILHPSHKNTKKTIDDEANVQKQTATKQFNDGLITAEELANKILHIDADTKKKKAENDASYLQKYVDGAMKAENLIGGLVKASETARLNAIQHQMDMNDKLQAEKTKDIENSSLDEIQKAAAIDNLNAQMAVRQKALQKEQRDAKIRDAEFDKAKAIMDIILNTTVSVTKVLYDPFQAILVGAAGAAELAVAIAQPIPKFEHGTDYSPPGWALTDEAGAEGFVTPGGKFYMGSDKGPTMRYLEEGTKVIPSHKIDLEKKIPRMPEDRTLANKLDQLILSTNAQTKAINSQGKKKIHNHNHIDLGKQIAFNNRINERVRK